MHIPSNRRAVDTILVAAPPPVVLAYGIGVDSTALLIELEARGEAPDLVLSADPGAEKPETYEYQRMIAAWMHARGIPYEIVRYVPRRFQDAASIVPIAERPTMEEWIASFNAGLMEAA